HIQIFGCLDDVLTKTILIGKRRVRVIGSTINGPSQVFQKIAVNHRIHPAKGTIDINFDAGMTGVSKININNKNNYKYRRYRFCPDNNLTHKKDNYRRLCKTN